MGEFVLTVKQLEANELLAGPATHIMLAGGSRSGKTFLLMRAMVMRALKAPYSRHLVARFRLSHIRASIVQDTFPKVMSLCFPGIRAELNKSELYATLPGGSEIYFAGLDDKERTEKILGTEFSTIFLEECSQIPWGSRNLAVTRLAQLVDDRMTEHPLKLKMYYAENPPDKGHWTYRLFKLKQDPESKRALANPEDYAFMQMNPVDNLSNLGGDYLKTLQGLSGRLQKRFLEGEFRDSAPNALFSDEIIDKWRVIDADLPDMLRVVVAIDPSGSDDTDNAENDEIGIVVVGLGTDGNGYLLEDLTLKAGPGTWGRVATQAFDRHMANIIVAEVNFGGAMVKQVIHSARPRTPFKALTASRGKAVRAEPISALMETGKVRLAGFFRPLEEELCFVSGTLIETANGQMPIEMIKAGDLVMTRQRLAPVKWAHQTGVATDLVTVVYPHGCIICTPCHPIFDPDQSSFVNAADVKVGQSLHVSPDWANTVRQSNGAAGGGRKWLKDLVTTAIAKAHCFTEQCGSLIADLFQPVWTFTTKTRIQQTIASKISSCLRGGSMLQNMPLGVSVTGIVPGDLRPHCQDGPNANQLRINASFAQNHSRARAAGPPITAHVSALTRRVVRPTPVYNLHLEDGYLPEYFANGVLVHNCGFTTSGYMGEQSPNRADAFVWGMSELFPELAKPERKATVVPRETHYREAGWMAG